MRKIINKNEKGITLIALVITIIVLLILAGVSISMLAGENGILKQATNAETKTGEAGEEESVNLAVLAALTTGNGEITEEKAYEVLRSELKKAGCKNSDDINSLPATAVMQYKSYDIDKYGNVSRVLTIEDLKESGEPVGRKTTLTDKTGDQIVIPKGFKIKSDSPVLVDRGIVVVAPDGSEFVWVPVENAVYDSANEENIPTSTTNGTKTGYTYTPMAIQVDGNYKGLLYNFDATGGAYLMYPSNANYQGTSTRYREPDTLSSYDTDTKKPTDGLNTDKTFLEAIGLNAEEFASEMTNNYNEMVESVKDNKGFYVGRYETSLRTGKDGITKIAQSRLGATSANASNTDTYIWYGLYQKEKEYSEKNSLTKVIGSSMIWGSQYDQMMIWMQTNGIDVKSKTPTNLEGVTISGNTGETTGTVETDKLNNIYDLLGNRYEWTLEAYNDMDRILRGGVGDFYDYFNFSPSSRLGSNSDDPNTNAGSRLTLYVK